MPREASRFPYFHVGDWLVRPEENLLVRAGTSVHVEPRAMDVLLVLAAAGGAVVTVEQLLVKCWRGTFYGDSPVRKAIAQLRKAVDDSSTAPEFIATLHKRGYRLLPRIRFPDRLGGDAQSPKNGWAGTSPFRGLNAFEESHAEVFFGRERAVATILAALDAQEARGNRFVVCVGASGSGKTSLIQAGVIPALKSNPTQSGWQAVASCACPLSRGDALDTLTMGILSLSLEGESLFQAIERTTVSDALRTSPMSLVASLSDRIGRRNPRRPSPGIIMVLDDIDGIFHTDNDAGIDEITSTIRQLACSPLFAVVASCRSDAYPVLSQSKTLMELKGSAGHVDVAPPDLDELAAILRQPARMAGLSFERIGHGGEYLDDVLLRDAGSHPECLPLLQYTLSMLYEQRDDNEVLKHSRYLEMGGLDGSIATYAEAAFVSMAKSTQSALAEVLGRTVVFDAPEGSVRSRDIPLERLSQQCRELCAAFTQRRLFVTHVRDGQTLVRPTHDALLRNWWRCTDWIAAHRKMLSAHARIEMLADHWHAFGRKTDLLLAPGLPLEEGRGLSEYEDLWVEPIVRQYVGQSLRRQNRRRLFARMLGCFLLLLSISASVFAWMAWQARGAETAQRESAEQLIAFIVDDLNEALLPLGRIDLTDRTGKAVAQYLSNIPAGASSRNSLRYQSEALLQLTNARLQQGRDDEALELALRAKTLLEPVVRHGPDQNAYRSAGAAEYWIGLINHRRHRLDAARNAWSQYADYTSAWLSEYPHDQEAVEEHSYAVNNLAVLEQNAGNHRKAEALFRQSITLKRNALERRPGNHVFMAELADSLSWLGSVQGSMGRFADATTSLIEAAAIIQHVRAQSTNEALWIYREAVIRQNIGLINLDAGAHADAANDLAAAERLFEQAIANDPENTEWKRSHTIVRHHRAWAAWLLVPGNESRQRLTATLQAIQALARDAGATGLELAEAAARARLAVAMLKVDATTALALVQETCERFGPDDEDFPQNTRRYVAALSCMARGDALLRLGDTQASEATWRSALARLEAHRGHPPEVRLLDLQTHLQSRLGIIPTIDGRSQLQAMGFQTPFPVSENNPKEATQ